MQSSDLLTPLVKAATQYCETTEIYLPSLPTHQISSDKRKLMGVYTKTKDALREMKAILKRRRKPDRNDTSESEESDVSETETETESELSDGYGELELRDSRYNVCVFCHEFQSQLYRHLRRCHAEEPEMESILDIADDPEKKSIYDAKLKQLKHRGNYEYNQKLSDLEKDKKVNVYKFDGKETKHKKLCCPYCKRELSEQYISKHVKDRCSVKKMMETEGSATENISGRGCRRAGRYEELSDISDERARKILARMQADDIRETIRSDADLRLFLVWQCFRYQREDDVDTVRNKVRTLARFLIHMQDCSDILTIFDCCMPKNFELVLRGFRTFAGLTADNRLIHPSLAKHSGEFLYECCQRIHTLAARNGQEQIEKDTERWINSYRVDFPVISREARMQLKERKFNKVLLFPLFQDIEIVNRYLDTILKEWKYEETDTAYKVLARALLAKVILFNRKRPGETQRITVETFRKAEVANSEPPNADIVKELDKVSRLLIGKMFRIEFPGKRFGNGVLLFTPLMLQACQQLVKLREKIVDKSVPFLFARPDKHESPYLGGECLSLAAKGSGVQNPERFKATPLRKHLATMSHSLHLSEYMVDHLAVFMGHNIGVHRHYYQQQMSDVQKSHIAQVLVRINTGEDLRDKSLEEIDANFELRYAEDGGEVPNDDGKWRYRNCRVLDAFK